MPPGGNWCSLSSRHPSPPPARGTRRNGPSIVAEGVINEGMTRGNLRARVYGPPRVGIVHAILRKRASKAAHFIASRQKHRRKTFYITF